MVVRTLTLVRPCLGLFYLRAYIPFFHISYSSTMILVSASSSCFALAVPMREVSCVGYTPRAWDPSSLQSIHTPGPLVFRGAAMVYCNPVRIALWFLYYHRITPYE